MSRDLVNLLWFGGWLVAVAVLFAVALRLPLDTRRRGALRGLYVWGIVAAAVAVVVVANVALARHDVHIDLTREKIFTPSQQAMKVVDELRIPVHVTYFYQGQDAAGRRMKEVLEVMGRRNPALTVRTVDPDREPSLAQSYGMREANSALLEAEGRKLIVRTTDENELAIGIQRVLREQVVTICYIEGHNEFPVDNYEFHTHFEGSLSHSHNESDSAVVQMAGHGIGRMRRALEGLGYDVRKIALAGQGGIPSDCSVTIDAGPRTTYLPAESAALEAYLRQGGSLALMYDLGFVLEPRLEQLMRTLGVRFQQAVVVDPQSHYSTDPEMVAVTAYERHPITKNVAFTFYPGVRPLELLPPAGGIQTFALISSSAESYPKPVAAVAQRQLAPERPPPAVQGKPQPHVLAAAIEGKLPLPDSRPFRAVLIGDADFASNSFLPYMSNSDLSLSMVRWLAREENNTPIASRIPVPAMILLTKRQMQEIFLAVEVLLPLLVIALGGIIWWRRR